MPSTASHRTGSDCSTTGAAAQRAGDHAAGAVAAGDDLATNRAPVRPNRRRPTVRHHRRRGRRRDLDTEADVAALGDQCIAKAGDQLVLRIHVVRPVTGDGSVVEDHTLLRRAELAAVVGLVERQDAVGDVDGLQRFDRPVVDRAGLGHAAHVGLCVTLEHDEVDAGALQTWATTRPAGPAPTMATATSSRREEVMTGTVPHRASRARTGSATTAA